jgi:hypothetical protein
MKVVGVETILGPPNAEDAIEGCSYSLAAKCNGADHLHDMAFGVTENIHDDGTVTLALG